MLGSDMDVIIPWDRDFASQDVAMSAFLSSGWQEAPPGAFYGERYWTLGAALRWIAERSQEAVDQPFALDGPVHEAVGELQEALEAGEIILSGCLEGELVPRDFPPPTWGVHTVALRDDENCLWPCVVDDGPDYDSIFRVRLRRDEVLRRWPPNAPSGSPSVSTARKEAGRSSGEPVPPLKSSAAAEARRSEWSLSG
jgi:hypothetical protein